MADEKQRYLKDVRDAAIRIMECSHSQLLDHHDDIKKVANYCIQFISVVKVKHEAISSNDVHWVQRKVRGLANAEV